MAELGKILLLIGAILALVGVVLIFAGRAGLPLGRLPGDITYRGKHTVVYFPLVTCIVLSLVLSLVFYLISRFHR
jgi:hypothetical protein